MQRSGGGKGIPLSNGEQTAHPTDIVMWIDTDVIENSLTKDDASYYNSSHIWIRTYGTFEKPNSKLSRRNWQHVYIFRKFQMWLRREATVVSRCWKSFKWDHSTNDESAQVRTSSHRSVHLVRTASFRSVHNAIVRNFRCSRVAHCNHFCFQVIRT